jgi:putative ABC transport system permease protein
MNAMGRKLAYGRNFLIHDFKRNSNVALIGNEIAREISAHDSARALGFFIKLNDTYWEVIGIIGTKESAKANKTTETLPLSPFDFDKMILLPFDAAFSKLGVPKLYSELDYVAVNVGSLEKTEEYKKIIDAVLKKTHQGSEDYKTIAPVELLHQKQKTQRIFNSVLLAIAALSLLVGGIGIMNIMLANVLERIKEIGIRRAIGATKKNILYQFLAESVSICLIGGILGILVGMLIILGVSLFSEIPVILSIKAMALSFTISLIVGVVFGILPAQRAASVNPIKALHSE